MATGENFMRICANKKKRNVVTVDKKTEQQIKAKIAKLQTERDEIYENLSLSDDDVKNIVGGINELINELIESMYK